MLQLIPLHIPFIVEPGSKAPNMPSVVMKTLLRDQEVRRIAETQSEVLAVFQTATKVVPFNDIRTTTLSRKHRQETSRDQNLS